MPSQSPPQVTENSEEGRALLQTRVALFWKVMFIISLLSSGMGAVGAIARPGMDFVIVLISTVQTGVFWWLCRKGQRSIRFSRLMEAGGLFLNLLGGASLGRYLVAGFVHDQRLLTAEGALMADGYIGTSTLTGTPQYMAPESILTPDLADARTDIYALGAVAYFLLAGREVFNGTSIVQICSQHLHQAPDPLAARGVTVPADLEALVLSCLEKDPKRRPQSAAELRRKLVACALKPWLNDDARAWWLEHQAALDSEGKAITNEVRTVAIDGAFRLA